jgi:hypothetical protein
MLSLEAPEKWITSLLVIGAGLASYLRGKGTKTQLHEIQLNVDGRLGTALTEIEDLKREILKMKDETIQLRTTTAILTKLLGDNAKNGKPLANLEP